MSPASSTIALIAAASLLLSPSAVVFASAFSPPIRPTATAAAVRTSPPSAAAGPLFVNAAYRRRRPTVALTAEGEGGGGGGGVGGPDEPLGDDPGYEAEGAVEMGYDSDITDGGAVGSTEGGEGGEQASASDGGEGEGPEEDPEVAALKGRIADLESKLRERRAELDDARDAVETYSELGYTRKVAEMDQIRKLRGLAFKSNEFAARASVLRRFLPVLDELTALDERYPDDESAGRSYSALSGTFRSSLSSLGAAEFAARAGDPADVGRHEVAGEEYSDEYGRGAVVECLGDGMEVEGNVMRMAGVVVSLGSEEEAKKKAEEEEAKRKAEAKEEEAKAEAEAEAKAKAAEEEAEEGDEVEGNASE